MAKILFITGVFPFLTGEQFIETEIEYLANSDNEIIVFPLNSGGVQRKMPCSVKLDVKLVKCRAFSFKKVLNILLSRDFYLEALFKPNVFLSFHKLKDTLYYIYVAENIAYELTSYAEMSKAEDVLIYSYWAHESSYAATILKKQFPALHIITRCHRYDLYKEARKRHFMPMNKQFLNDMDAIIPCSESGESYLTREYGISKGKIFTSRLGTADHGYGKGFNGSDKLHIVSCSYMVPVKRIHLIIDALVSLQISKDITWTHIGDGGLKESLEKMAEQKLNKVKVNWVGSIPNSEVLDFYKANKVDCFINVSASEGIPVSIMEATSFGIPIVAMDVGGVNEIVSNRNGLLLHSDATDRDIAKGINTVHYRNTLEFRKKVRNTWCENYNAKKNYTQFLSMLKKLFK